MTSEELRDFLVQRQVQFEEKKLPHGLQFRCSGGEIFSVFKTGRFTVQGSRTDLTQAVEKWQGSNRAVVAAVPASAAITEPSAKAAAGPSQ